MSVISKMEVTPNRVGILYRFLDSQSSPLPTDVLKLYLSPKSLWKKSEGGGETPSKVPDRVLEECTALGLVESGAEADTLQVPQQLRGLNPTKLRLLLTERLTHPDLAAAYDQPQVPHALAWFLTQHPATPLAFRENQKEEIEAETGGRHLDLTNFSRFQHFSYWVQYLGLGWQLQGAAGLELVPDPSVAITDQLCEVLAGKGEASIRTAIEALGDRLPIMETGVVRTEVEGWLSPKKGRDSNDLSPSTSLAFLRLQRRGVIGLDRRADATVMRLLTWPDSQQVSDVRWTRMAAGR